MNFFVGFPGERFSDFMETFDFIKNGEFRVQGLWAYLYDKNSPAYQNPEQFGFKLRKGVRNPRSLLEELRCRVGSRSARRTRPDPQIREDPFLSDSEKVVQRWSRGKRIGFFADQDRPATWRPRRGGRSWRSLTGSSSYRLTAATRVAACAITGRSRGPPSSLHRM